MDNNEYMVGKCMLKCSEKEIRMRQTEKMVHLFETTDGRCDQKKMVKCFSRSAAGHIVNCNDVRPFEVLLETVSYLYINILPYTREKPIVVYEFIFDRLRAVRQDIVIQNLSAYENVQLLEPIINFYVYFSYILCEESIENFDKNINTSHLLECLKRLLVFYEEFDVISKHQFHFQSLYLLLNLGSTEALSFIASTFLKPEINDEFKLCYNISLRWYLKNYSCVLRYFTHLPVLSQCILFHHLPGIRKYVLKALSNSFSSPRSSFPANILKSLLLYNTVDDLYSECDHFGIKYDSGNIIFLKSNFNLNASTYSCVKRLCVIDDVLTKIDIIPLLISNESFDLPNLENLKIS